MDNTVFLNTNREMPLLGLGVYKATGENEAESAIISAVESGYRLIDTASVYKNEENVGRGIASCGIPRSELFITTKVWNTAQRLGDIQGAFERSLDRLKLDYVDLYLFRDVISAPGKYWRKSRNPDGLFLSVSATLKSVIWKSWKPIPELYLR